MIAAKIQVHIDLSKELQTSFDQTIFFLVLETLKTKKAKKNHMIQ
jgi:hypothetical protein